MGKSLSSPQILIFIRWQGKNLANLLLPHLVKIINFDHFQVFKDATAYTAITFFTKENNAKVFLRGKL